MGAIEHFSSRRTSKKLRTATHDRVYHLAPYSDSAGAMGELESVAPATVTVGGVLLIRSSVDVEPIDGRRLWLGMASYSPAEAEGNRPILQVGEGEVTVRIVGETQTLRHSYRQQRWNIATSSSVTSNSGGPINDAGDGPEGVEVLRPSAGFGEKWILAPGTVDAAWVKAMSKIVGKVNNAEFRGFAAGELLLLGIQARSRADGSYEADYEWSVRPNIDSQSIAGVTVTNVQGHWYVWVKTRRRVVSGEVRHQATHVVVDRVYEYADYGDLDLPGEEEED